MAMVRLYRCTYRRGLRRCSFRQTGDARASERGTSDKKVPTLFFVYSNQYFFCHPSWESRINNEMYHGQNKYWTYYKKQFK